MLFLIDTCFWNHISFLYDQNILDLRQVLENFRLGLTNLVKTEIKRYQLHKFVPLEQILIIPIEESDFTKKYKDITYLDKEDQSLIIAYDKFKKENPLILTDDGGLFSECLQTNRTALLLPLFILSLVRQNLLSKNKAAKCLRFWEKTGAYKRKEIKIWKLELQKVV